MDSQRKKPGVTAKAAFLVRTSNDDNESMHDDLSGAATLVAISPVDEEIGEASPSVIAVAADSVECRRSSRKKIPKFDVRDLLLKQHRKPHKIQIEARIDSNAPSTSRGNNNDRCALGDATTPLHSSLDKCFIEKTSIIQRTPAVAPIPVATEIFKPSQTSSMIVAQMESSSPAQRQLKSQKTSIKSTKTSSNIESDLSAPKRRGRPPKNRNIAEIMANKHHTFKEADVVVSEKNLLRSDVNTSKDIAKVVEIEIKTTPVSNLKNTEIAADIALLDVSDLNMKKIGALDGILDNNLTEEKSVLCLKGTSFGTKKTPTEVIDNAAIEKNSAGGDVLVIKLDKKETASEPHCFEECSGVKIENSVQELNIDADCSSEQISPFKFSVEANVEITTEPPHSSEGHKITSDSRMFVSTDLEQTETNSSSTPPRKTTTPTPRRYERRSGRRMDETASGSKTLEETFAEIAAKSSKAILEMATQKSNDGDNVQEQPLLSVQVINELNSDSNSLSYDGKKPITASIDATAPLIKKRGRKPKSKVLGSDESHSEETSLEKNYIFVEKYVLAKNTAENETSSDQVQLEPHKSNLTISAKVESEILDKITSIDSETSKESKVQQDSIKIEQKPNYSAKAFEICDTKTVKESEISPKHEQRENESKLIKNNTLTDDYREKNPPSLFYKEENKTEILNSLKQDKKENLNYKASYENSKKPNTTGKAQQCYKKIEYESPKINANLTMDNDLPTCSETADKFVRMEGKDSSKLNSPGKEILVLQQQTETVINQDGNDAKKCAKEYERVAQKPSETVLNIKDISEDIFEAVKKIVAETSKFTNKKPEKKVIDEIGCDPMKKDCKIYASKIEDKNNTAESTSITKEFKDFSQTGNLLPSTSKKNKDQLVDKNEGQCMDMSSEFKQSKSLEKTDEDVNKTSVKTSKADVHTEREVTRKHQAKELFKEGHVAAGSFEDKVSTKDNKLKKKIYDKSETEHERGTSKKVKDKTTNRNSAEQNKDKYKKFEDKTLDKYNSDELERIKKIKKHQNKEKASKERKDKSTEGKLRSKKKSKSLENREQNTKEVVLKPDNDPRETCTQKQSNFETPESKTNKPTPPTKGKLSKKRSDSKSDVKNRKKNLKEKHATSSEHSVKEKKKTEIQKHKIKSHLSDAPTASSTPMTVKNEKQTPSPSPETSKKGNSSSCSQSHKKLKKHKDSLESTPPTSKEADSVKEARKTETSKYDTEVKMHKLKDQDKDKQARRERQRKLEEALTAALDTRTGTDDMQQKSTTPTKDLQQVEQSASAELSLTFPDLQLPPTPGSDKSSKSDSNFDFLPESKASKSNNDPDPFYDIAKFIEDGVNLLKRDYKLAENEEEIVQENPESAEEAQKTFPENVGDESTAERIETVSSPQTTQLTAPNSKIIDLYETPADTPATTPGQTTPSSSPVPTDNTDNSLDTYYYSDGKRRSHRLKKITSAPKAMEGRGLAKLHYSLEDHLTDLAEVEAKNAQFLKDMEERLSNFQVIKESEYHCERLISREARKMICDCFLTPEEAERGELGCGEDCLNRLLMIECGANCKVGERCTNNRFQKILCAPCRVFRTEKKGFGIMADVEIHPGEFIMEYVGEVLDSEEFEYRRQAYSKDKNRHYYFMELRRDAIIDATTKGNISRFINHSCDPNAETQKWTVNGELRIGFFTRKTIMPGEEITFDYQYQRYGRDAQRCYCESANCRGWIGEEPDSDEGEQVDDDEDDDEEDDEEEDEDEAVRLEDEDQIDDEKMAEASDKARRAELLKTQTAEDETTLKATELDESKQKFMAYLGKISAKFDNNKQNKLEEKKLRKKRKRKQDADKRRSTAPAASRFLEDPELEDEIDFLSRCGLKNQSDTLRFSRLMVRAKLISTRLNLLAILREGELPCRRLFLDYHGLHLLHGWMNEDGRTDMAMRLSLLQTLECLPITNKTVLTDSKVYQALRGWCSSEKQATIATGTSETGTSSSPSDESSKESGEQKTHKDSEPANSSEEIEKFAAKLLSSWDKLQEIFRIPKRERIEQMKEHEREADRQYAATIEANESAPKTVSSTDRYQRDRFERRFGKQYGIRNIGIHGGSTTGNSGASGSAYKKSSSLLSSEDTKNLSKEQRRELFAAKVAHEEAEKRLAERRREFETKCNFFGLDPRTTRPEDVPFCVSDSGQWFNEQRQQIAKPPAFAHIQTPIKPKSTNPADYYLPKATTNLPPEWAFAITDQGKIYYYHLKQRVPQWEPPTPEQISQTKWSDTESESDYDEEEVGSEEISEERIKEIEAIQSQEDLSAFLKKISQEQRQVRYKQLVEERPISPRREEDRIYNQIEMRKYKENKEKIKKRKEEIRRRRSEAAKSSVPYMCTLGSLLDAASKTSGTSSSTTENAKAAEPTDLPSDALPIQDFLLSSDDDAADADDEDIDEMKAECNNSPLLEKIVQGDKIVDELDALTTKRKLKRSLPPHRDLNIDLNSSGNSGAAAGASTSSEITSSSSMDKVEYKKRRQEKKEKSKRSRDSSDTKYRKLKEKFRCEIAGIIVQHLKPYRKDSCTFGRIRSNEDFNHLARKLTHFVMVKELKYCDAVGQTLVVTESVKNKSREFIKKYMAKYEKVYVKPANDPEFKDIPFTL